MLAVLCSWEPESCCIPRNFAWSAAAWGPSCDGPEHIFERGKELHLSAHLKCGGWIILTQNLCLFSCYSALCCCTQQVSRILHTSWEYSSLFLGGKRKGIQVQQAESVSCLKFFFYFSACLKYFKAVTVFLWDVTYQEVFVLKFQSGKNW